MKPIQFWLFALAMLPLLAADGLEFEVASIRPGEAWDGARLSLGLHVDGSQARFAGYSLRDCIGFAYAIKGDQIIGPDWIASERFNINATLPPGAEASQIPEMMQKLLADRFQLKFHRERRDLPVYVLGLGKGPLQLKEVASVGAASAPDGARTATAVSSGASVSYDLGNEGIVTFGNNRFEGKRVTIAALTRVLERYLDRPLLNQTALGGAYDLTLPVTEEDAYVLGIRVATRSGYTLPPGLVQQLEGNTSASLFGSLERLGLRLEPKKMPQDVVVIDRVLKAPTEN